MPDGDVITRTLAPHWRQPYRLMQSGFPTVDVAAALQWGIAQDVRETGGLPGLAEFASVYESVRTGTLDPMQALGEIRDIGRAGGDNRNVWIAVRAVQRRVMDFIGGSSRIGSPQQIVTHGFLEELIECQLFARAEPALRGRRFQSHADASAFRQEILKLLQPDLSRMSEQIIQDPTGRRVHARRNRRAVSQSPEEILRDAVEV